MASAGIPSSPRNGLGRSSGTIRPVSTQLRTRLTSGQPLAAIAATIAGATEEIRAKRRISRPSIASAQRCSRGERSNPSRNAASTSRSWTCSQQGAPVSRPATSAAGTAAKAGATVQITSGRKRSASINSAGAELSAKLARCSKPLQTGRSRRNPDRTAPYRNPSLEPLRAIAQTPVRRRQPPGRVIGRCSHDPQLMAARGQPGDHFAGIFGDADQVGREIQSVHQDLKRSEGRRRRQQHGMGRPFDRFII